MSGLAGRVRLSIRRLCERSTDATPPSRDRSRAPRPDRTFHPNTTRPTAEKHTTAPTVKWPTSAPTIAPYVHLYKRTHFSANADADARFLYQVRFLDLPGVSR